MRFAHFCLQQGWRAASCTCRGDCLVSILHAARKQVHFTYTNTYITSEVSSTNQLQFYAGCLVLADCPNCPTHFVDLEVNNQRSLSLMQKPTGPTTGNVGGALHGLWRLRWIGNQG